MIIISDLTGFVGVVTNVTKNLNRTREYFTVHFKESPTNMRKIIISNHKNSKVIRQKFLDAFHNKAMIQVIQVVAGTEVLFFNAYSEVKEFAGIPTFDINEADATKLEDVYDEGLVNSVVGKIQFTGEVVNKTYTKGGKQRTDPMRECLISDGTSTVPLTLV